MYRLPCRGGRLKATKAPRPIVLASFGDPHCGSRVGLCPPQGVELDDGQRVLPSNPQLALWECYEKYLREVATAVRELKASLVVVCGGDAVEGQHHGTQQVMAPGLDAQHYLAQETFMQWAHLAPAKFIMVRGTVAHVGPSATAEEALAHSLKRAGLPIIGDPKSHLCSHWDVYFRIHGHLINVKHHGKGISHLAWTKDGAVGRLAFKIWLEHVQRGWTPPALAFRHHLHHKYDSEHAHPTRLIGVPSFQLKTEHVHNALPEVVNHVGGAYTLFVPDEEPEVRMSLTYPEAPEPLIEV